MMFVSDVAENQGVLPVNAVLCVDREAFDRFGRVLRHLSVGLVDQAVNLRLLSCDPSVEKLALGPVQTVVHQRIGWPVAERRTEALLDTLSSRPPTVVHALSGASYRVAGAIAEAFDTDLVFQVTSLKDCDAIANFAGPLVGRFVVLSPALATVLEEQLKIPEDRINVIRPGVLASQRIACFADPQRIPTLLCFSPFERGSGVDRLIKAVNYLRKREHAFMLFLLGAGRQESVLRRMIHERKLLSCVTFAHPVEGLNQILQNADIFVRPSKATAFTDDGLQAMGAGMAVVTLASSICDHFRNGETAVICEKAEAEPLANTIEQLLRDRSGTRHLATSAREYVRTHHTISRMAECTADVYRKLALARATFSLKE